MGAKILTMNMMKKFGEIQEVNGTIKGTLGTVQEICGISLEKGYVYEVFTTINQSVSNSNAINSMIYGDNCTVYGSNTVRGYGGSGGGVTNHAIVKVEKNNATVKCSTYIYDNTCEYYGYIRARKVGII